MLDTKSMRAQWGMLVWKRMKWSLSWLYPVKGILSNWSDEDTPNQSVKQCLHPLNLSHNSHYVTNVTEGQRLKTEIWGYLRIVRKSMHNQFILKVTLEEGFKYERFKKSWFWHNLSDQRSHEVCFSLCSVATLILKLLISYPNFICLFYEFRSV